MQASSLGATTSFSPRSANLTSSAVNRQVNGVAGGNSSVGTINSAGLYTPSGDDSLRQSRYGHRGERRIAFRFEDPHSDPSAQPHPCAWLGHGHACLRHKFCADVTGSNFINGAQIQAGGATLSTTFVSAIELQATATIPNGITTLSVSVVNPNPGSAQSGSASATIYIASVASAARLLDQATFGPTLAHIPNVQIIGIDAWITHQFNTANAAAKYSIPLAGGMRGRQYTHRL